MLSMRDIHKMPDDTKKLKLKRINIVGKYQKKLVLVSFNIYIKAKALLKLKTLPF